MLNDSSMLITSGTGSFGQASLQDTLELLDQPLPGYRHGALQPINGVMEVDSQARNAEQ